LEISIDYPNHAVGIRESKSRMARQSSNRVSIAKFTGRPQGATVNPARLNLDSSGAYEVAKAAPPIHPTSLSRSSVSTSRDQRTRRCDLDCDSLQTKIAGPSANDSHRLK